VGGLLGQAYLNLVPLMVLLELGDRANGLFYIPWTIAWTIDMVSHNMGVSLTVEGASDPAKLGRHVRTIARRLSVLMIAGTVVTLVGAELLLRIYGEAYAANCSNLLRLLAIGALFRTAVILAQSATRALGEAAMTVWTEGLTCALVLGLSLVLLPRLGIEAAGWAWLVANAAAAAAATPRLVAIARRQEAPASRHAR